MVGGEVSKDVQDAVRSVNFNAVITYAVNALQYLSHLVYLPHGANVDSTMPKHSPPLLVIMKVVAARHQQ